MLTPNRSATSRTGLATVPDLSHPNALELVCETSSGNIVLLASKITKQGIPKPRVYS
jgi:hypothetical protein